MQTLRKLLSLPLKITMILAMLFLILLIAKTANQDNNSSGNVLSAKKELTPIKSGLTVNCDFFPASWKQFKRDFMETQYKTYESSKSAEEALNKYLESYQKESRVNGCPEVK